METQLRQVLNTDNELSYRKFSNCLATPENEDGGGQIAK